MYSFQRRDHRRVGTPPGGVGCPGPSAESCTSVRERLRPLVSVAPGRRLPPSVRERLRRPRERRAWRHASTVSCTAFNGGTRPRGLLSRALGLRSLTACCAREGSSPPLFPER